jgi:hypothetical protein
MLAQMAAQTSTIANAVTAGRAISDLLMTPRSSSLIGGAWVGLCRYWHANSASGASRLADYETGHSRDHDRRPAPIPKVVELALKWLEFEEHRLARRMARADARAAGCGRVAAGSAAVAPPAHARCRRSGPRMLARRPHHNTDVARRGRGSIRPLSSKGPVSEVDLTPRRRGCTAGDDP